MKTMAVTADAAFVAQRGGDRLAKRDAAVFHRVMRVHFQIAVAAQIQIHRRVLGKQREHVVEKGNAGFDFGFPLAIQIEADGNPGFLGVPFDFGRTRFHRRH